MEAAARAAAGGGSAEARRCPALSGLRWAGVAAVTGARGEERRLCSLPAHAGGNMDGDRTESDWQGLVSEVRPGLRVGLRSRCSGSPSPASPGSRWPRQDLQVHGLSGLRGRRGCPHHLVPGFGEGPFARQCFWPRIGETKKPWDPGGERAKPHLSA